MKIALTDHYRKDFHALPQRIQKKARLQMQRVAEDIRHPSVKARKMTNVGDVWEGRVDRSFRFTFCIQQDVLIFRRIGTHQIYRKP